LGSFVFELCCGQTDRRTDSKILPTPTDIVGVGNNNNNNNNNSFDTVMHNYRDSTFLSKFTFTPLTSPVSKGHNGGSYREEETMGELFDPVSPGRMAV